MPWLQKFLCEKTRRFENKLLILSNSYFLSFFYPSNYLIVTSFSFLFSKKIILLKRADSETCYCFTGHNECNSGILIASFSQIHVLIRKKGLGTRTGVL